MAIFPTFWELVTPRLSGWTVFGIILIALGFLFVYMFSFSKILRKVVLTMWATGIVLIFGVSIVQNFLSTVGGAILFWGSVIVILLGIFLFWNPKTPNKNDGTSKIIGLFK